VKKEKKKKQEASSYIYFNLQSIHLVINIQQISLSHIPSSIHRKIISSSRIATPLLSLCQRSQATTALSFCTTATTEHQFLVVLWNMILLAKVLKAPRLDAVMV